MKKKNTAKAADAAQPVEYKNPTYQPIKNLEQFDAFVSRLSETYINKINILVNTWSKCIWIVFDEDVAALNFNPAECYLIKNYWARVSTKTIGGKFDVEQSYMIDMLSGNNPPCSVSDTVPLEKYKDALARLTEAVREIDKLTKELEAERAEKARNPFNIPVNPFPIPNAPYRFPNNPWDGPTCGVAPCNTCAPKFPLYKQ